MIISKFTLNFCLENKLFLQGEENYQAKLFKKNVDFFFPFFFISMKCILGNRSVNCQRHEDRWTSREPSKASSENFKRCVSSLE